MSVVQRRCAEYAWTLFLTFGSVAREDVQGIVHLYDESSHCRVGYDRHVCYDSTRLHVLLPNP
jgi:hypothetical protein